MKIIFSLFLPVLLVRALAAQAPYTEKKYNWLVDKDLVYGAATNYLGQTDTLTLDLYMPENDDPVRPLAVLVHGGSWLSGCKEDMAWLCEELAARGYVAATVNYRKGWHKAAYVPNPINPAAIPWGNCLYALDSTEILRAIYRGMQDVKGAIRWLKAREGLQPDCQRAVVVGGESAGAFIALAVSMLDRPAEKPLACGALPDAPAPDPKLSNCFAEHCAILEHALPPGALARPDLGPVEGNLNQNGFDARVAGVMSFYGAVPAQALADDWIQGPDTPAMYLYHQTCDGVVPFNSGKPFWAISTYCNLGFTPWHYQVPNVYGNGAIASYLASLPAPPPYQTDFLNCAAFDPNFALFECIRYNDNGSYHFTHNRPERAVNVSAFFSPQIAAILANPPCVVATSSPGWVQGMRVAPNPFHQQAYLYCAGPPEHPVRLTLCDARGRVCWQNEQVLQSGANRLEWDVNLPGGLYFLHLAGREGAAVWKMVK